MAKLLGKKKWLLWLFLNLILIIILTVFLFEIFFAGKIYPRVTLAKMKLGGMSENQATKLLEAKFGKFSQEPITLKFNDQSWKLEPAQIELGFDASKSAHLAYLAGRKNKNFFLNFGDQLNILFADLKVSPTFSLNENHLEEFFDLIAPGIEKEEVKPKFVNLDNNQLTVDYGQAGLKINRQATKEKIVSALANFDNQPINLVVAEQKTDIQTVDLNKLLPKAQKLLSKKLVLKSDNQSWVVEKGKVLNLLTIDQSALVLGGKSFDKLIAEIKKNLEREPQNARFSFADGKVISFQPSIDGQTIDLEKFKKDLMDQLLSNPKEDISFEIPLLITKAKIKTAEVNNFGIQTLIGRGSSNFSGSAEGRIHNILLATQKVNGTLIAPGEIFSFDKTVGEVSQKTGYTTAYIISKGQTILGEGGGVCQVSTTAFRAAVYSGLPIIDRTAHAYRVHYYEQAGYPVGLDATVFEPTVDLKFKNDTPNYILIHAYADLATNTLYFDFYGADDGRKVEVSRPQITNQSSPPTAKYEVDPSLPSGTIKQIDFAAWGATVEIKRKVTKNGEVLVQDTFRSNYRPWQAVYQIGPDTQIPQ